MPLFQLKQAALQHGGEKRQFLFTKENCRNDLRSWRDEFFPSLQTSLINSSAIYLNQDEEEGRIPGQRPQWQECSQETGKD